MLSALFFDPFFGAILTTLGGGGVGRRWRAAMERAGDAHSAATPSTAKTETTQAGQKDGVPPRRRGAAAPHCARLPAEGGGGTECADVRKEKITQEIDEYS